MQYISWNSPLLAKKNVFISKEHFFLPKVFQKVRKSQQILLSRQNNVCLGLKVLSKSKLFSEGFSCLRTTSATLCHCHFHSHCHCSCHSSWRLSPQGCLPLLPNTAEEVITEHLQNLFYKKKVIFHKKIPDLSNLHPPSGRKNKQLLRRNL